MYNVPVPKQHTKASVLSTKIHIQRVAQQLTRQIQAKAADVFSIATLPPRGIKSTYPPRYPLR